MGFGARDSRKGSLPTRGVTASHPQCSLDVDVETTEGSTCKGSVTLSRIRLYNPHVMLSRRISPSSARSILSSPSRSPYSFLSPCFSLCHLFQDMRCWFGCVESSQFRRDRDRSKKVLQRKYRNRRRGRSTSVERAVVFRVLYDYRFFSALVVPVALDASRRFGAVTC